MGCNEESGMTDLQYKGMLIDQRSDWEKVLTMAKEAGNAKIQEFVEGQLTKINEKLKF